MNADHLDLLLAFILREKRFLKKRETSFTDQELRDGEQLLKRALKVMTAKKLTDEELRALAVNENKAKRMVLDLRKRVKSLSPKQLLIIVQNYELVYSVIEKKHKEHKIVIESLKGDRFYNPRRRVYA
ncbi:hypothetical protein KJ765_05320 [Candidatus Micrarchaeota archaeon]|nr:hypothetical protein [Candidatus Micrarchaeota archaeon]